MKEILFSPLPSGTTITSLMPYGECKSAYYCSGRGYYLKNVIDNNVASFWYPADYSANARINLPSVMDAGTYAISYAWRGDGNYPYCNGKISVSLDGMNYTSLFNASATDILAVRNVTINQSFKYIKVEVGYPYQSCGWVRINEISITNQPICIDSDEYNIYTNGSVVYKGSVLKDSCIGNNLLEYYCSENTLKANFTSCPSEYYCNNGACIKNPIIYPNQNLQVIQYGENQAFFTIEGENLTKNLIISIDGIKNPSYISNISISKDSKSADVILNTSDQNFRSKFPEYWYVPAIKFNSSTNQTIGSLMVFDIINNITISNLSNFNSPAPHSLSFSLNPSYSITGSSINLIDIIIPLSMGQFIYDPVLCNKGKVIIPHSSPDCSNMQGVYEDSYRMIEFMPMYLPSSSDGPATKQVCYIGNYEKRTTSKFCNVIIGNTAYADVDLNSMYITVMPIKTIVENKLVWKLTPPLIGKSHTITKWEKCTPESFSFVDPYSNQQVTIWPGGTSFIPSSGITSPIAYIKSEVTETAESHPNFETIGYILDLLFPIPVQKYLGLSNYDSKTEKQTTYDKSYCMSAFKKDSSLGHFFGINGDKTQTSSTTTETGYLKCINLGAIIWGHYPTMLTTKTTKQTNKDIVPVVSYNTAKKSDTQPLVPYCNYI